MSARTIQLSTSRLDLRSLRSGDESDIYRFLSDQAVIRYMLFPLFTPERAARFVHRLTSPPPPGEPEQAVAMVRCRGERHAIGLCGLVLARDGYQGELWYLLESGSWGSGYATEAAGAVVAYGFDTLTLHRIWASCLPENPASARVLEKLRFRREGHHLQNLQIRGTWRDSFSYALLRSEWQRRGNDAAA
jgi:[ribosomal protein S5]-alanine N-acetyltransferase